MCSQQMLFKLPYELRMIIWKHASHLRYHQKAHELLMHELSQRMRIACCVNDIISDGQHISVETCKIARENIRTLMEDHMDLEPSLAFNHILISLQESGISHAHQLLTLRIMLWQYCKILPMMTEHEIVNYCDVYNNIKACRCDVWGCVAFATVGLVCGALCTSLIE